MKRNLKLAIDIVTVGSAIAAIVCWLAYLQGASISHEVIAALCIPWGLKWALEKKRT